MDGKCLLEARLASSPQNARVTLRVFCETGSDMSPPGGDTAPITLTDPSLFSLPRVMTLPARS